MLSNLLKLYSFKPFSSMFLEDFVKRTWEEKAHVIHEDMIFVGNSSLTKALPSLLYRYPVYYGKPMPSMFSTSKWKALMKALDIDPKVDPDLLYVWGGPVEVVDEKGGALRKG